MMALNRYDSVAFKILGFGLISTFSLGVVLAQDESAKPDKGLDYWKGKAAEYRIALEPTPDKPLKFHQEPALKWSNPVRQTDDGAVFLWTDRGRPEVIASFYRYKRDGVVSEEHEFMSLSETALAARRDDRLTWSPTVAGIVLAPIPDAPPPAAAPGERLRQARKLAGEFKAFFNNPPDLSELRPLSHPIYRYEIEKNRADVLDGAVFAFVHTTDPEVLLVIEARPRTKGGPMAWHYAFARMSMVNLRAEHKGRQVWSVDWDSDLTNPSKPYMSRVDQKRIP